LGDAAAIFGAGQADRVTDRPQQRGIGLDVDVVSFSVDGEFDLSLLLMAMRRATI
jgi:hypothetical protein